MRGRESDLFGPQLMADTSFRINGVSLQVSSEGFVDIKIYLEKKVTFVRPAIQS